MKLLTSILFAILFSHALFAQFVHNPDMLPFEGFEYQEVAEHTDDGMQLLLDRIISNNPTYKKLVHRKKLAVGIVDLRNPSHLKYASVNGDHMMYAASLPKIAVLLAAMDAVEDGCLNYDANLKKDMRRMIAKSNNAATTRVIERLGYDKIASVMQDERYNLYNISNGGGLWVGKKYAKSGRKKPDPLKGLSHAATVEQVCRFYTMLAYGELVNPYYNQEMMNYLIDPEINHKFVRSLNKIAPDADVYRKSGSWRNYHSDSALVMGENGRQYILTVLVEDNAGSKICSDFVYHTEKILGLDKAVEPIRVFDTTQPILAEKND